MASERSYVPDRGIVREHYDYGRWATDAPPVFHVASILTALATMCADRALIVRKGAPYPLHLWALLVGRSTLDRKTTSAKLAMHLVGAISQDRLLSPYGSPEALLDHIKAVPCVCLFAPEGGAFFSQREAGYWKHAKETFMDLYDYTEVFARRLRQQEIVIKQPRVSLLVAAAEFLVEKYTSDVDWLGGFIPRFLQVAGEKIDNPDGFRQDALVEGRLKEKLDAAGATDWGVLQLSPGAERAIVAFEREIEDEIESYDSGIRPCLARLPHTAVRLAGLYTIARQAGTSDPSSVVAEDDALHAAALCRTSRDAALRHASEFVADPGFQKQIERAKRAIGETGGEGIGRSALLRRMRIRARELDELVDYLEQTQLIRVRFTESDDGSKTVKRYVLAEEAPGRSARELPPGQVSMDSRVNADELDWCPPEYNTGDEGSNDA